MSQEKLKPYPNTNFVCDSCQGEFRNETAYSFAPNLDEEDGYYTYCVECVKLSEKEKRKKSVKSKQKKKNLGKDPQDKRITGRTRQLNLKVTEETYWLLKKLALKKKCLMTEVVEKSLENYRKKGKN